MKVHLLVFNASQADRKTVQRFVDKLDLVENWFSFFDNAICLASTLPVDEVSRHIRRAFPELVFMMTTVDAATTNGWMPKAIWDFLENPQPASVEAA